MNSDGQEWVIDGGNGTGSGPKRIAGLSVSSYVDDIELDLRMGGATPQEGIGSTIMLTVGEVTGFQWEEKNSPISDNPSEMGGGKRIYPGKTTPNDGTDRTLVVLKATVSPEAAGYYVWFDAIDVDDPSQDHDSAVEEYFDSDGSDDTKGDTATEVNGDDNFSLWFFDTGSGYDPVDQTDSDGIAYMELELPYCPGDNLRGVSGFTNPIDHEVTYKTTDGTSLTDKDGNDVPNLHFKATPVLTVWRRLHLERDCMDDPDLDALTGNITAVDKSAKTATVDIDLRDDSHDKDHATDPRDGRFQRGKLSTDYADDQTVNANGEHDLYSTTGFLFQCEIQKDGQVDKSTCILGLYPDDDAAGRTRVTVSDTISSAYDGGDLVLDSSHEWTIVEISDKDLWFSSSAEIEIPFTDLRDDDHSDGDPEFPNNSLMQTDDDDSANLFARAYVMPVWDGAGHTGSDTEDVTFAANLERNKTTFDAQTAEGSSWTDSGETMDLDDLFWVAYIQGAYQGSEEEDRDPYPDGPDGDEFVVLLGWAYRGDHGGFLFRQTHEDCFRAGLFSDGPATRMARTTAHEIAHQFDCPDRAAGGGLMSSADCNSNLTGEVHLIPEDILIIRQTFTSPGER